VKKFTANVDSQFQNSSSADYFIAVPPLPAKNIAQNESTYYIIFISENRHSVICARSGVPSLQTESGFELAYIARFDLISWGKKKKAWNILII
jgi:hypothetical protein